MLLDDNAYEINFYTDCLLLSHHKKMMVAMRLFFHMCIHRLICKPVSSLRCMKRELQVTADGSHTIAVPDLHVTYHSRFGAIQESRHVFIKAGLQYVLQHFLFDENDCVSIFEMGLGTGLNALLSLQAMHQSMTVYYYAAELYPLSFEEAARLNYVHQLQDEAVTATFSLLHSANWNEDVVVSPFFSLHKADCSLLQMNVSKLFHLIYFDAFAPDAQPELWTETVFKNLYNILCTGGVLVTYCSKGTVRRTLQAVGFSVEKLKGPPGKREMLRAIK